MMNHSHFDEHLKKLIYLLPESKTRDAMEYSLLAGGKRLRPEMLVSVATGYGLDEESVYDLASALEMIHTYSLIHDDLPAMDNDDLRRGKPTCHKQFDEATAILAGDGLLTYAFEVISNADFNSDILIKVTRCLANKAGSAGMVLGQTLDIHESEENVDFELLKTIHKYKTGCLFSVPLMIGAIVANKDESTIQKWNTIGEKVGLAFQIQDDIFDLRLSSEQLGKSNSDERNHKITSVTLLGESSAEKMMNDLYDECNHLIDEIGDFDGSSLKNLIEDIKVRLK